MMSEGQNQSKSQASTAQRFTRAVGFGVFCSALILCGQTVDAAEDERGQVVPGNWPPNPNVEFTRVFPFPDNRPGVGDQNVPTGNWIQHAVGWNPDGKDGPNSKERVKEFIEGHRLTVKIGGEEVEDPKQYYIPVKRPTDGEWIAVLAYTVPPQPPGTYSYKVQFEIRDEDFDTSGQTFKTAGEYTVEKGDARSDQGNDDI